MAMEADILDSGCCGMAGAFGFEAGDHFQLAQRCGERVLLPSVRKADKETLLVADGFSCREMISQNTDRHALHLAEVIRMGLREGPAGTPGRRPERSNIQDPDPARTARVVVSSAVLLAAIGVAALALSRRKS